jgi:hypothetical protein
VTQERDDALRYVESSRVEHARLQRRVDECVCSSARQNSG